MESLRQSNVKYRIVIDDYFIDAIKFFDERVETQKPNSPQALGPLFLHSLRSV